MWWGITTMSSQVGFEPEENIAGESILYYINQAQYFLIRAKQSQEIPGSRGCQGAGDQKGKSSGGVS